MLNIKTMQYLESIYKSKSFTRASEELHISQPAISEAIANLEKERLKNEVTLMKAKTESIKAAKNIESLYKEAINAMRSYGGHSND